MTEFTQFAAASRLARRTLYVFESNRAVAPLLLKEWNVTFRQGLKRAALALAVFSVLCVFQVTISFSTICPKCLQYAHGLQISLLGIPCYYRLKPSQTHDGLGSPDAFTDRLPPVNPKLYQKITGKCCKHSYRKLGFCRYSLAMVRCGGGGPSAWDPQLRSIEEIYRTYERIGDRNLAQQSFRLVNREVDYHRVQERRGQELDVFWRDLQTVASRKEWADIIALHEAARRVDVQPQALILPYLLAHTNAPLRMADPSSSGNIRK